MEGRTNRRSNSPGHARRDVRSGFASASIAGGSGTDRDPREKQKSVLSGAPGGARRARQDVGTDVGRQAMGPEAGSGAGGDEARAPAASTAEKEEKLRVWILNIKSSDRWRFKRRARPCSAISPTA